MLVFRPRAVPFSHLSQPRAARTPLACKTPWRRRTAERIHPAWAIWRGVAHMLKVRHRA